MMMMALLGTCEMWGRVGEEYRRSRRGRSGKNEEYLLVTVSAQTRELQD